MCSSGDNILCNIGNDRNMMYMSLFNTYIKIDINSFSFDYYFSYNVVLCIALFYVMWLCFLLLRIIMNILSKNPNIISCGNSR